MGGGWSQPRPGRFTCGERDPVLCVQVAGWALGPVWTGVENLALTGIRSPGRPVHSAVVGPRKLVGTYTYHVTLFLLFY